jgi:hypothetical protein
MKVIRRRILEKVTTIAEAIAAGSLEERQSAVCDAVRAYYRDRLGPDEYAWPRATFDDKVIVNVAGKLWSIPYTIADGVVTLNGDGKARVQADPQTYSEVAEGTILGPLEDERAPLLEAAEAGNEDAATKPTGKLWQVLIIQEGMSKNRNRYSRETLTAAAPLYENAQVFIDHQEQPRRFGRSARDLAGFLKGVTPVVLSTGTAEASSAGRLALAATLVLTKASVREEVVTAWNEGNTAYLGLSHDVQAESQTAIDGGGVPFYDVTKIESVDSVDLVTNPAAGGRLTRLVASATRAPNLERDGQMLTKMIEAIRKSGNADLIAKLEALGATPNEDGVLAIFESLAKPVAATPPPVVTPPAPQPTREAVTTPPPAGVRHLTEAEYRNIVATGRLSFIEATVRGTALPDVVKTHVVADFSARVARAQTAEGLPSEAEITEGVRAQVELYGKMAEASLVVPSSRPQIEIVKDRRKKFQEALDSFFDPNAKLQSFKAIYVEFTGDVNITGQMTEAVRLTESIGSGTFDQILGDSITRRLLKDYAAAIDLNNWRGVVAEVVPVADFRAQRRMRFGGYGNLPTVGQFVPYGALSSPTDEEATYSPAKRGGTESISIEAITNDDVGAIRRIPGKLGRSAAQTLHEFVWDFLANNGTIYDTVALAAAGHNNIVTTAMSSSNIASLRLKIKQQTDMSNGKRLGLAARNLIVPSDLEELAFQLTNAVKVLPDTSIATTAEPAAPNFINRLNLKPTVVDYWTDPNNYWVAASPDQTPMIEVGFVGGREEPEIFVSDTPNNGSMFHNDSITWKIKHTYGGAVLDFRGLAAGIVA